MINDLRFKIFHLLIALFVYLFISNIPVAATALSLSLDPSIIEINAIPPSALTSTLSIQNKSGNQVQLRILLKPFKAKLENGELEYLDLQDYPIFKNVQILDGGIPVEDITLAPSQQKKLTLNINISQDINISARPPATSLAGEVGRDYYFSILFLSENSLNPGSNVSSSQLGIATNVLLSVGEKEMPNAIIEEFSSGLFYESGPVPFTVRIKNKGIHFIKPKGEILIKNMFGQSIGKLDLVSLSVLSNATRAMPNNLNLDFKHPKALWKEHFLLGFYTATLNIALSDESPRLTRSTRFLAFPFQGLILIVIVLISVIKIVNRVRSQMKK